MSDFALQVGEFARKTKLRTDTVIRKAGAEVLASVVNRSPVDTGRFRANWVVSYEPTTKTTLNLDRSGIDTINRGLKVIQLLNPGQDELWITNGLPYARRLEYGWSQQAPAGMVRITVREWRQFIDKALQAGTV